MQSTADLKIRDWKLVTRPDAQTHNGVFVISMALCTLVSLAFASWLPLQVSIVTVFLFAGPHNWFELRYFLMRLPLRFGKSRNFFLTAFVGIGLLTLSYVSLPFIFNFGYWSEEAWSMIIAGWNTLLLSWLGLLTWLRAKQKRTGDWSWVGPLLLALGALNWLAPMFFSLAIVYLHPLIALWFLDRHLARTRRDWLRAYRLFLCSVPLCICVLIWTLSQTSSLSDDNGLFWRITQHSGAALLPGVSTHLLVSLHLFLEMLHYAVWIIALPLIVPLAAVASSKRDIGDKVWNLRSVPLVRHSRGFPKLIATTLIVAAVIVVALWVSFSVDYSTTRDVYFTLAIAHVLAEAPFLLRML